MEPTRVFVQVVLPVVTRPVPAQFQCELPYIFRGTVVQVDDNVSRSWEFLQLPLLPEKSMELTQPPAILYSGVIPVGSIRMVSAPSTSLNTIGAPAAMVS